MEDLQTKDEYLEIHNFTLESPPKPDLQEPLSLRRNSIMNLEILNAALGRGGHKQEGEETPEPAEPNFVVAGSTDTHVNQVGGTSHSAQSPKPTERQMNDIKDIVGTIDLDDVTSNMQSPPELLSKMPSSKPYYVAHLSRAKCEAAVKSAMIGDFLIRRSNSSRSEILCVNDNGEAVNFSLKYNDKNTIDFVGRTFDEVDQVVAYLKVNALRGRNGSPLYLLNPATIAPWYAGNSTRTKLVNRVLAGTDGDFMVRKSSKDSVYKFYIHSCGDTVSFVVERSGTGLLRLNSQTYPTLEAVVNDLRCSPIPSINTVGLHLRCAAPAAF